MSAATPKFPPPPVPARGRAGQDRWPLPPPKEEPAVPISLAEKLREESDAAGVLNVDYELAMGGGGTTSFTQEFAGDGVFARDGRPPCGCVAFVAKAGPRELMVESSRPGRAGRYPVRETFAPSIGVDSSLKSPEAWTWFSRSIADLRAAPDVKNVPLLVLIESNVAGELTTDLRAALTKLAASESCVIAVTVNEVGLRFKTGDGLQWEPFEEGAS